MCGKSSFEYITANYALIYLFFSEIFVRFLSGLMYDSCNGALCRLFAYRVLCYKKYIIENMTQMK